MFLPLYVNQITAEVYHVCSLYAVFMLERASDVATNLLPVVGSKHKKHTMDYVIWSLRAAACSFLHFKLLLRFIRGEKLPCSSFPLRGCEN